MQQIIEIPGDPIVHLRHVDYSDTMALYQVIERSRDSFAPHLNWTVRADALKVLDRIENQLYLSSRDEGMAYCVVEGTAEEPGRTIGSTRLFERYPHWRMHGDFDLKGPVVHCGSWLSADAQGQGIMLRVRRALFRYAQQRWGIENIFMDIAIDNRSTERSAIALGAVPMGISYWQMQRLFGHDDPRTPEEFASVSADVMAFEQRIKYTQKVSSSTIPMQRWLLRLDSMT